MLTLKAFYIIMWRHHIIIAKGSRNGGASLGLSGKEFTCQSRRGGFHPCVRKIPWRRAWQPTPVFLPGESHGQRSLVGCSPWGRKELDTTWPLNNKRDGGEKGVSAVPPGQGTAGTPFCRAGQNAQQNWPPWNRLFCQSPLIPPAGWERNITAEKTCLEVESRGASGEAS